MNPTEKVTFLFTDIEGSTKLSQDFPEKLHAALESHNQILKEVLESNNGFIYDTIGDSFFCAFENAEDAVKAAVEIQTELAHESWDEAVIRVRIGIHSGNAEWNGNNYMGYITLARTTRVMSAAYGEQILISNDAHELFLKDSKTHREKLQDQNSLNRLQRIRDLEAGFRDLGERRLKDVIQPIRLYQIISKGLRENFPPLKTLDARPNNLPIQLTSFIGREKELKYLKDELKENKLLTLTGTGGAGKSRLSLQAGADLIDDFENGVWFVELASFIDPDFLTAAIINALGIKEEPKKTPEETLIDHLKDKEILILLDNCEHLINACADLTERLLSSCPKLKIIATSREALNCSGEQIFKIPALTHPDPNSKDTPEQLTQYESVRLFIERALSVNPKFRVTTENAHALAEVCSRLDGIPLAIELAAARIKVLSIEKIFGRLDDRFNLLTGGKRTALPRQQTLRALIDWSYDLLTEKERILWSRLSVFSGGWTLEAAEEICSDETINKNEIIDLLNELSEKSVTNYNESRERYNILETIKQYGREKLENENEMFLRHLDYFLDLAQKAETELNRSDAKLWLDKLEADHSNFISAIEWAVNSREVEKGAGAAYALAQFWTIRGYHSTGKELLDIILNKKFELSKSAEARLLILAGGFSRQRGDYTQAKKFFEESLNINIEISDKHGIADSFSSLGCVAINQGDYEEAIRFFEETLRIKREFGDKRGISLSLNNLGSVAIHLGNLDQAKEFYEESLDIKKEIGDRQGIANSLNNLGIVADYHGNYEQAKKYNEESLDIRKEIGDKWGISHSLHSLGNVALNLGDFEDAKKFFLECRESFKDTGDKRGIANCLNNLGIMTNQQGNYEQSEKYLEESLEIRKEIGDKWGISHSLTDLGNLAFDQGDFELAKKYYYESLAIRKEIGNKSGIADTMSYIGIIATCHENYETAVKLLSASEKIQESIGSVFEIKYQKIKDETKAKIREQISEKEFNKYWEEGKNLTLDEAIALALRKEDNA